MNAISSAVCIGAKLFNRLILCADASSQFSPHCVFEFLKFSSVGFSLYQHTPMKLFKCGNKRPGSLWLLTGWLVLKRREKIPASAWFQRCESFLRLVHAEHVYGKHSARDVMLAGALLLARLILSQ